MEALPSVAVIICAAGSSSRIGRSNTAGVKKEYQKLDDSNESLTVLGAAVSAFCKVSSINVIVIAIPPNTEETARAALPPECLSPQGPEIFFVDGGQTRRASVFKGLSFLAKRNPCYVLIHDGARPWVSPSLITDIIKAAVQYGAVIPLLPLSDTPKECTSQLQNGKQVFIKTHLKRANTGAAQTPQGFKFSEILLAHEKAAKAEDEEFTDDAEVYGRFCGDVAVIPGMAENRKITFIEDFHRAAEKY